MRALLEKMICRAHRPTVEQVARDIERDKILTAEEAVEYGLDRRGHRSSSRLGPGRRLTSTAPLAGGPVWLRRLSEARPPRVATRGGRGVGPDAVPSKSGSGQPRRPGPSGPRRPRTLGSTSHRRDRPVARIGDGGDLLKCSFCGKSQKQVKKLIAGPGVYICDECIDLCNEIIEEELDRVLRGRTSTSCRSRGRSTSSSTRTSIGQDKAKKALSVAVYNHYKRVQAGRASRRRAAKTRRSSWPSPTSCCSARPAAARR